MEHLPEPLTRDRRSRWWRGERGLETVEYALIAALLVVVLLAILPQVSQAFIDAYTAVNDALADAMSG